jgi:signal transduction histidine kinase
MPEQLRNTGLKITDRVPWSTHFCQLYRTKEDLLDVLVPYFQAGLENNEFCLWNVSGVLTPEEVKQSLNERVPGFSAYLEKSQIEILSPDGSGEFDADRVLEGWAQKLDVASARGFFGLRVNGITSWAEKGDWIQFNGYENAVNSLVGKNKMLVFCSYRLDTRSASEVIDIIDSHAFSLARRDDGWEVIENSAGRIKTVDTLRALSRRLVDIQENERCYIARELHDEIGQSLTALNLMMAQASRCSGAEADSILRESQSMVAGLICQVRELSLQLRPSMLDDLGLLPTLLWHIERYTKETRIKVEFEHNGLRGELSPDIIITIYRIIQEALTDVAIHAEAKSVSLRIWLDKNNISLKIEDRGKGFPASAIFSSSCPGLSGIRERVLLLGGKLDIDAAPGQGTSLVAELPLRQPVENTESDKKA